MVGVGQMEFKPVQTDSNISNKFKSIQILADPKGPSLGLKISNKI
jgi:hypothetical protein